MEEPQPPSVRLLPIGELLNTSILLFRMRWLPLLVISLVPVLTLVLLIVPAIGSAAIVAVTTHGAKPHSIGAVVIPFIVAMIVLGIINAVCQIWSQLAMLYVIKGAKLRVGIIAAYGQAWRRLLSYWWLTLIHSFIVIGGVILFFVPGIVFAVWFCVAAIVFVEEDLGGTKALLRSKDLVNGVWWSTAGRLATFVALLLALFYVPLFIMTAAHLPAGIGTGYTLVIALVTPSLTFCYLYQLYRNLRWYKEQLPTPPTTSKFPLWAVLIAGVGLLIFPLSILAVVVLVAINPIETLQKARDSQRVTDQAHIERALDQYEMQHGYFPTTLNDIRPLLSPTTRLIDPQTGRTYAYQAEDNGRSYSLCLYFERLGQKCVGPNATAPGMPSPMPKSPSVSPTPTRHGNLRSQPAASSSPSALPYKTTNVY